MSQVHDLILSDAQQALKRQLGKLYIRSWITIDTNDRNFSDMFYIDIDIGYFLQKRIRYCIRCFNEYRTSDLLDKIPSIESRIKDELDALRQQDTSESIKDISMVDHNRWIKYKTHDTDVFSIGVTVHFHDPDTKTRLLTVLDTSFENIRIVKPSDIIQWSYYYPEIDQFVEELKTL